MAEIVQRIVGPDPSGEQYTGVMIALVPEPKLAEVLEIDGGESAEIMHLTLAYLPPRDDETEWAEDLEDLPTLVQQWAEGQPMLSYRINGYGTFANEDENALWASPDCPGLPELRQSLVETLTDHDYFVSRNHGFTPHMTVKYQDDPITEIPSIPADAQSTGPVWLFSHVWFCNGPEWTGYPLGGGMQTTAGPASGRIPKAMRMLKVPFQMLRQPRPVVLDRPAQEDLEDVPQNLKERVLDAIESVSQGVARLEAKTRELTGAFTVRITNAWRAAFYMGVDSKFHCFWIGDHNYDEAERRFASRFAKIAAAEQLCRCCGGWGEHDTGQECYRCDGGFHVPEAEVADEPYPCDGFLGIQGSLHTEPPTPMNANA